MSKRRILLVEDNQDDVDLTLLAMKRLGLQDRVDVARDGAEAIEALLGGESEVKIPLSNFSLVLLDLNIPKISGLQVLERVKAHGTARRIPIVVLTSSRDEGDLKTAYSLGANAYVRKSIDYSEFHAAVRLMSDFWLDLNELPNS